MLLNVMPWNDVQPPCNHCLRTLWPTLPTPLEQPVCNATCGLPPHASRCKLQLLSLFPGDVAIGRTADVRMIGTDLVSSMVAGWLYDIPYHSDIVRFHKPMRMMPIPSALHWNLYGSPKLTTNISMDDGH